MSVRGLIAATQPRENDDAVRSLAILAAVAGLVTAVFAPLSPGASGGSVLTTVGIGVVVLLFAGALWRRRRLPGPAWTVAPYVGLLCIAADDLLTSDVSVSAQIFLFFPVLFAGKQLQRPAAIAVTVAAVLAELAVVLPQMSFRAALIPCGYVGAALVATGGVLINAAEQRELLVEKLRRQAAIDPLTGLATRTVLDQAAVSALSGAAAGGGTALLLLDIDSFKQINDTFGHPAGDQVLIQLAGLLHDQCSFSDVVSRLGGDEIAVLLPGCSVEGATERAGRFLAGIRGHSFDLGAAASVHISVSVGVAHAPTHAGDLRGLYSAADEALYRAKRAGKNQIAAAVIH